MFTRFCFMPRSTSVAKNPAPPSAVRPPSSVTPKLTVAPAGPQSENAAQAVASAAEIFTRGLILRAARTFAYSSAPVQRAWVPTVRGRPREFLHRQAMIHLARPVISDVRAGQPPRVLKAA